MKNCLESYKGILLYPSKIGRIKANEESLIQAGYKESESKPLLFFKRTDECVFYADMRGTEIVPTWRDTSPLFYAFKFRSEYPDWEKERILKQEMNRLEEYGCHVRSRISDPLPHIYGQPGAEKDLLLECPPEICDFENINESLAVLENKLTQEKATFIENLPKLIHIEKERLENLEIKELEIQNSWDEKINQIKKSIRDNKTKIWSEHRIILLFTLLINYVDLFIKIIFKISAMMLTKNAIIAQKKVIFSLENEPDQVFQEEQKELIREMNQLEEVIKSPCYSGAKGEHLVLNEFKKLTDEFHILPDVNINLTHYVRYRGIRNLKSAQIDFVVVGPTGIFAIEVKNWSQDYLNSHTGFSPHEQVDRAGLVLFIYLKSKTFLFKPKIANILVPIQHNLSYNPNYKFVFIKDLSDIRKFILDNNTRLSDREIKKVVTLLKSRSN